MHRVVLLLALLFATPTLAAPEATVTRTGDRWTVDYRLDQDAAVWAFAQSALTIEGRRPWRSELWTVETPGVVLERIGARDVLRAADGGPLPRAVRVRFRPVHVDLEAANDPYLVFSEGSAALSADQFDLYPFGSLAEVEALPHDLNGVPLKGEPLLVTWRDEAGAVMAAGKRDPAPQTQSYPTYILFGAPPAVAGEGLTAIVDPGLPVWIGDELKRFEPRIADYYRARLGPGASDSAAVLVSWNGATPGKTSMGGSTLPGLIATTFEGEGVVEPNPRIAAYVRWFFAHETAHFWFAQRVRYERSRDAWITEGAADIMAFKGLKALDPTFDDRRDLQKSVDECTRFTGDRAIETAEERGEHRAYYSCGAVFHLVADALMRRSGGDVFDFLKRLLDANADDGVLTKAEWLTEFDAVSGDPSIAADMRLLIEAGAPSPGDVLARILERSGVPFRREEGRVVLL